MDVTERTTCRACDGRLDVVFDLGSFYVSDFLLPGEDPGPKVPLTLARCADCTLVQLTHTVSAERLYRKYWYLSGTNPMMRAALKDVVDDAIAHVLFHPSDVFCDIGANDGTLLSFVPTTAYTIGFEPAQNVTTNPPYACPIPTFFNAEEYWKWTDHHAKVITACAMFYDLEDPNTFLDGVKSILHPEGVFVIQMGYLGSMLETNSFDSICHEHLEYYDLTSIERLLEAHGLQVIDAKVNDVNGGSLRVLVRHAGQTLNKVQSSRVHAIREREQLFGTTSPAEIKAFGVRVESIRRRTLDFIESERGKGKIFWALGASTKGSTLLQHYGLHQFVIGAAVERQDAKVGRVIAGTGIPIISESEYRQTAWATSGKPDYLFVLPWHFIEGLKKREEKFLNDGRALLVPLPYPYTIKMVKTLETRQLP